MTSIASTKVISSSVRSALFLKGAYGCARLVSAPYFFAASSTSSSVSVVFASQMSPGLIAGLTVCW